MGWVKCNSSALAWCSLDKWEWGQCSIPATSGARSLVKCSVHSVLCLVTQNKSDLRNLEMRGSIRTSHILKLGKLSDWGTAITNNQKSDEWTLERNKEKQLEKMFTFFFFFLPVLTESFYALSMMLEVE